jgi:hypothetical protein
MKRSPLIPSSSRGSISTAMTPILLWGGGGEGNRVRKDWLCRDPDWDAQGRGRLGAAGPIPSWSLFSRELSSVQPREAASELSTK